MKEFVVVVAFALGCIMGVMYQKAQNSDLRLEISELSNRVDNYITGQNSINNQIQAAFNKFHSSESVE